MCSVTAWASRCRGEGSPYLLCFITCQSAATQSPAVSARQLPTGGCCHHQPQLPAATFRVRDAVLKKILMRLHSGRQRARLSLVREGSAAQRQSPCPAALPSRLLPQFPTQAGPQRLDRGAPLVWTHPVLDQCMTPADLLQPSAVVAEMQRFPGACFPRRAAVTCSL